jgi:hypothetical protein
MTDDHEYDDAYLDALALVEARIREDVHGGHIVLEGALTTGRGGHVMAELVNIAAAEFCTHHGDEGALEVLAHHRSHELQTGECQHTEASGAGSSTDEPEITGPDHIAYEISELTDTTASELAALTRAVERLGDIIDKRLA